MRKALLSEGVEVEADRDRAHLARHCRVGQRGRAGREKVAADHVVILDPPVQKPQVQQKGVQADGHRHALIPARTQPPQLARLANVLSARDDGYARARRECDEAAHKGGHVERRDVDDRAVTDRRARPVDVAVLAVCLAAPSPYGDECLRAEVAAGPHQPARPDRERERAVSRVAMPPVRIHGAEGLRREQPARGKGAENEAGDDDCRFRERPAPPYPS
mmetsp:Transcript_1348/g.3491  ORF Transcript_1348/g.3491 Transcript_1348/m.3491 type:complete len:219 (-) Transcript_1348:5-661(-)